MRDQRVALWRSRWAAIGAAVAVTLGGGGLFVAHAVSSGASSYVPITPCRLLDTRPVISVGGRSTPLGAKETITVTVRGTNGNCTIPTDATGVAANVTTLNGSTLSYLTIFPADATMPIASTNNWSAGQTPTPNKVDSKLSADGKLKVYNDAGTVNVVIDVVGFYEPAGAAGSAGVGGLGGVAGVAGAGGVEGTSSVSSVSLSPTSPSVVTSIVVTAATDGWAVLTASATVELNAGAQAKCQITSGTTINNFNAFATIGPVDANATNWPFSATSFVVVQDGSTTYNLVCQQLAPTGGASQAKVTNAALTAVYSPTQA